MKKVAVIISSPPHGTSSGREALEAVLALSDRHELSLFFLEQGIFQILPNQNPEKILGKNYTPAYKMLELYDIESVFVSDKALNTYHLNVETLIIPVTVISSDEIKNRLNQQDVVLRF